MTGLRLQDLQLAARMLARRPTFAVVAVLSLAMGIGANSAIFSVINALLLRPLPHIQRPEGLVRLYTSREGGSLSGVSYPEYEDLRELGDVFTDALVEVPLGLSLSAGEQPEFVFGYLASGNYFSLLGVESGIGRVFNSAQDAAENAPVVVLSHAFWKRRFNADPSLVGRTLKLNGQPVTVVGIAPESFIGTEVIVSPDIWVPMWLQQQVLPSEDLLHDRASRNLRCTARLAPGVRREQARQQVAALGRRLAESLPETDGKVTMDLVPEAEARIEVGLGRALGVAATTLLALVGLVLLIACANVANLLLARATERRKEISVRLALGAGRGHLIRQLLIESLLISLAGGALGLFLAFGCGRLIEAYRPPIDYPLGTQVPLDGRVVLFTLTLSVLASLVFGLVPALQGTRPDLVSALKGDSSGRWGKHRRRGFAQLLVVAQVAVSMVLLVSAGLLLRSLHRARDVDLGMDPRQVMAFSVDLEMRGYSPATGRKLYEDLAERVRALPGVESVTLAAPVPMGWSSSHTVATRDGAQTVAEGEDVFYSVVAPAYFETLRTPLLAGRGFDNRDDLTKPLVTVVNQTLATRLWPGEDPLGRQLRLQVFPNRSATVVGVAANGKYRQAGEAPTSFVFLPFRQAYAATFTVLVRTAGAWKGPLEAIRRVMRTVDGDLLIFNAQPLAQMIQARALLPFQLMVTLTGVFGLLGLLLALSGLYGVLSYSVTQRRRAIAVRMALGASSQRILGEEVRRGLLLAGVGMGVGSVLAIGAGRLLSGLLLEVSGTDPLTFVLVAVALAASAVVASFIPARRATRVDPLTALKQE